MKFKIGKILITNEDTSKELHDLREYLINEIEKIHEKKNSSDNKKRKKNPQVLKADNPFLFLPYANFYKYRNSPKERGEITLKILKFWSSELPNAPQSIEYIINSIFAHGHKFLKNEKKPENEKLLIKIKSFFDESANQNGTAGIEVLKTAIRHACQCGDGYIEKVYTMDGSKLNEIYNVDPANIIVLKDEEEAKKGLFVLKGYAKVNDNYKENDKIDDDVILNKNEIVHIKYIDEGDAYGHCAFERNQELTKFIINILNFNQKKFTNEIRHSLHVHLGKFASLADANIFLNQYKNNYLGKYNYGAPLITVGDIEVEKWDLPDKDFDYLSFMEKIGMYHAPSLLNIAPSEIVNADAKYSNAEQGHKTTILNCIYPWQNKIERIVNNHLLRAIEGIENEPEKELTYTFVLNRENISTSYDHIQGINNAVMSGYITPNQAKRIIDPVNLPEINEDWANSHYVRIGNEIRALNEEFFAGIDEDPIEKVQSKDGNVTRLDNFFKA